MKLRSIKRRAGRRRVMVAVQVRFDMTDPAQVLVVDRIWRDPLWPNKALTKYIRQHKKRHGPTGIPG